MQWLGFHAAAGAGKDTAADYVIRVYGGEKVSLADPLKHFCRAVFSFNEAQLWGPSANRNKPDPRYAGPLRVGTLHIATARFKEKASDWLDSVIPDADMAQRTYAQESLDAWFKSVIAQPEVTPRFALQTLGTEWGRQLDEDIWLRYAHRDAIKRNVEGFAVISDCRFLNEAAFIHEQGGVLLEIVRPGFDGSDATSAGVAHHPSEMERVQNAAQFKKYITHTIKNDSTVETFHRRLAEALSEKPHAEKTISRKQ